MRILPTTSSLDVYWEDLVFSEAALLATDETKHLAAPITELLTEIEGLMEADRSSRRAVIQSMARSSRTDSELDEKIRDLHSGVLGLTRQNRSAPEVRTLFPTSIAEIVRPALKKQLQVAEGLLNKLSLGLYTADFRDKFGPAIEALVTKGKSVWADRTKAELGRTQVRLDVESQKATANATRLATQGALLSLAADKGHGKSWVESFFMSAPARATVPDTQETDPADNPTQ